MGAFIVDGTESPTVLKLNVPKTGGDGHVKSKEVVLADHIITSLTKRTGRFDSIGKLKAMLVSDEVTYTAANLPVALELLVDQKRLVWPEVETNRTARPGWLTAAASRSEEPE
jgi:hypothetical protein